VSSIEEDIFIGSPSSYTSKDPPKTPKIVDLAQDTSKPNILFEYKRIKQRNGLLKASTYMELLKQTVVS